jgi:hypothetical protein
VVEIQTMNGSHLGAKVDDAIQKSVSHFEDSVESPVSQVGKNPCAFSEAICVDAVGNHMQRNEDVKTKLSD